MTAAIIVAIVGAIVAGLMSLLKVFVTSALNKDREMKRFYSWVHALLSRVRLDEGNIDDVRTELTAPDLHYLMDRLWSRIPETSSTGLQPRLLILDFVKGGGRLAAIRSDQRFADLLDWLEKEGERRHLIRALAVWKA